MLHHYLTKTKHYYTGIPPPAQCSFKLSKRENIFEYFPY